MKPFQPTHRANNRVAHNGEPLGAVLAPDALRRLSRLLKSQCKQYRKQLRRCQKEFSEKAVHDSRVAARRLLAIVELLAPFLPLTRVKKIERQLKQHLDTFDELRDTQVQLLTLRRLERSFPAAGTFKAHLKKKEERLARTTRKQVKKLKTGRFRKLVESCSEEVEAARRRDQAKAAGQLLLAAVEGAFTSTEQLKQRIDRRDTKTIHCTRVAFKKFRYMMETLADFVPSLTPARLRAMHNYQTLMGDVQDAQVLLQAFDKYRCKTDIEPRSARTLLQALLRRRQDLVHKFLRSANALEKFWPDRAERAAVPVTRTHLQKAALARKGTNPATN